MTAWWWIPGAAMGQGAFPSRLRCLGHRHLGDPEYGERGLDRLFRRVRRSLRPGGETRFFPAESDWAVLNEVHRVRLYRPEKVTAGPRRAGFEVGTMDSYGRRPFRENHAAFVARKP